jgi:hypothetical protein
VSTAWRITIASPPDRGKLVAEIFFGNQQWAEINQEKGVLEVEFYSRSDGQPWRIALPDAFAALQEAEKLLR